MELEYEFLPKIFDRIKIIENLIIEKQKNPKNYFKLILKNNEWEGDFQVVPSNQLLHLNHKDIIKQYDKVIILERHYQKMYARKIMDYLSNQKL
ncbi:MAG: hypothetical protein H0V82_07405 [Candidatus Protochlamydia sp.]|nr:hypothetical protein [Candidatus Protochlamydia sp.]